MMTSQLPKITHVLELSSASAPLFLLSSSSRPALFLQTDPSPSDAKHLPSSVTFYRDTLQLGKPVLSTERMAVFPLGHQTTLLLFQRGLTTEDQEAPPAEGVNVDQSMIPGHGLPDEPAEKTKLRTHFALAVESNEAVDRWEEELKRHEVKVLSRVNWPKGGKSLYFEDPDQHVGELVSPGIWPYY
ncbi:hypothetical protein JCM11641_002936 [Rhodosporidiobolus odoratus]